VSNKKLIKLGVSARPTIEMVECAVPELSSQLTWDDVYKQGVVNNQHRNKLIAKHAKRFADAKKPVLILVKELWHGDNIMRELEARGLKALFSHGQMPLSQVESNKYKFERGKVDVLVASTIYDEGVDVPAIRALVVADGGQSVRAVLQKIGRGLRKKAGGDNVLDVIDFADLTHRYLAKHSQERLAIYEAESFRIKT
jgi:superfamily II DNA or RNA helicase